MRSLGSKFGYWTLNPKEAWLIDSTMDAVNEASGTIGALAYADPAAKEEMLFDYLTSGLPWWLGIMEKRVKGKKFLIGSRITCADFMLGAFLCSTIENENHPNYFTFQHIIKEYP